MHAHTATHTRARAHAHTYTHIHAHAYTLTYTNTLTHAHTPDKAHGVEFLRWAPIAVRLKFPEELCDNEDAGPERVAGRVW